MQPPPDRNLESLRGRLILEPRIRLQPIPGDHDEVERSMRCCMHTYINVGPKHGRQSTYTGHQKGLGADRAAQAGGNRLGQCRSVTEGVSLACQMCERTTADWCRSESWSVRFSSAQAGEMLLASTLTFDRGSVPRYQQEAGPADHRVSLADHPWNQPPVRARC